MTQQDFEYRKTHAVVPQLDFPNGGYKNIVAPPIQYSKFAALGNVVKVQGSKVAGGVFGILEGSLHMATGDFGYGVGKMAASMGKTAAGMVDPIYAGTKKRICDEIREWEALVWDKKSFLSGFLPAMGDPGDIVCKNGEFHDGYCGLGHRFFDNGDYFEGLFRDGRIFNGAYVFSNGARYLGFFDDTLNFTGIGLILYRDGCCYFGGFNHSQRNGKGAMWYTNGVYIGDWSNDIRHGDGLLRLVNQNGKDEFYEGQFYNDQLV